MPPTPGTGEQGEQNPPTPGAPSGEQGKTDIQPVIDAIIRRERTDADARVLKLETRIRELEAAPAPKPGESKPPVDDAHIENIRKPLLDELTKERERSAARDERTKRIELKAAAKDSVDADEVADRLIKSTKITDDGKMEVVDDKGLPRYGANGPMTVAELVGELLAAKPFLAKAAVRDGINLGDVQKSVPGTETKESLKARIAELEAKGQFNTAAPLKTQLANLVASGK